MANITTAAINPRRFLKSGVIILLFVTRSGQKILHEFRRLDAVLWLNAGAREKQWRARKIAPVRRRAGATATHPKGWPRPRWRPTCWEANKAARNTAVGEVSRDTTAGEAARDATGGTPREVRQSETPRIASRRVHKSAQLQLSACGIFCSLKEQLCLLMRPQIGFVEKW